MKHCKLFLSLLRSRAPLKTTSRFLTSAHIVCGLFIISLVGCDAPVSADLNQAEITSPRDLLGELNQHKLKLRPDSKMRRRRALSAISAQDSKGLLKIARSVYTEPGSTPSLTLNRSLTDNAGVLTALNGRVALKHTGVSAEISGTVASVQVRQIYTNSSNSPIDLTYTFPLPENSAVDDMRMVIGERVITAQIKKRAEAKKIYTKAKREGKTAALLEQQRPNVFTQSVANIAPGHEIEIVIHYVQQLTYDQGEYEFVFPMVVGPRFTPGPNASGAPGDEGWIRDEDPAVSAKWVTPAIFGAGSRAGRDISIEVAINAGHPLIDLSTPTHETLVEEYDELMLIQLDQHDQIPNRDFVMRYRVANEAPQMSVLTHADPQAERERSGGFVNLMIHPPLLDVDREVGRREFIFVMDVSGSMSGKPLSLSKEVARRAIEQMRPVDLFNVITFAGRTGKLFDEPHPANQANLQRATQYIDSLGASGGTKMRSAIDEALKSDVASGYHRYVFFLTDGFISNEREIGRASAQLIKTLKRQGLKARVFGVGVGESPNRHLIDIIAKTGEGLALYANTSDDPAHAVNQFYQTIDRPILSHVKLDWGGLPVSGVTPHLLPDLFATRPLVINARYQGEAQGVITLTGEYQGETLTLELPVQLSQEAPQNSAVATLWARDQIKSLERSFTTRASTDPRDLRDVKEQITQLGLDFHLVTHYTSLIAVDEEKTLLTRAVQDERESLLNETDLLNYQRSKVGAASVFEGGLSSSGYGIGGGGGGIVAQGEALSLGYGSGNSGRGRRMTRRRPRLRITQLEAEGSLHKNVLRRVIRSRMQSYYQCYERALVKDPKLAGKLKVKLKISPQGKLIIVKVIRKVAKSRSVSACLSRSIKRLRFPKPKDGRQTTARVEFTMRP